RERPMISGWPPLSAPTLCPQTPSLKIINPSKGFLTEKHKIDFKIPQTSLRLTLINKQNTANGKISFTFVYRNF
ncbi:MAG: hypothetical protein K2G08_09295, partial [Paramuribaculum sp.]|nr:hypothetical protein [Paramuribaculum sp.]